MQIIITTPSPMEMCRSGRWLAALVIALAVALWVSPGERPAFGAGHSITSPDTTGSVGAFSSLALDTAGRPVISYYDTTNQNLKVMHCNDQNCAGGGESVTSPDTTGDVGYTTSLALDANGNPVVAYYDSTNANLKILHCDDADCAPSGNIITSPDTAGSVGLMPSIVLDGSGNPVVAYVDTVNSDLKLLHCDDPNCVVAGNSITIPASVGDVGFSPSLALDASGNPVVAHMDVGNYDLRVLHCNDPNCAPGGESSTTPDSAGHVGESPSLVLDASGNPVVSHSDFSNADLKLLHCNDPNCAPGGDSTTTPDTAGNVGAYSSLVLDAAGYPVISHSEFTGSAFNLKILHCNDANCAGGGESSATRDTVGLNYQPSLALDANGNPVVSYIHDLAGDYDLKVLHCVDADCSDQKLVLMSIANVGQYALPKTCFEVQDAGQVPLFEVCDNDFLGAPASNAVCMGDGICEDEDPAAGQVDVTMAYGDYYVVEDVVPYSHLPDTATHLCDATGGASCSTTFTNSPTTKPWYPWDIDGNGVVDLFTDIFGVSAHFGCGKGSAGEVCP